MNNYRELAFNDTNLNRAWCNYLLNQIEESGKQRIKKANASLESINRFINRSMETKEQK